MKKEKKQAKMHKKGHFFAILWLFLAVCQPLSAHKIDRIIVQTPIPHALILDKRAATAMTARQIFADSNWSKPTENQLSEGELVEIVAETRRTYEDHSQRQKFKWFRIRTSVGLEGWVYGDNLAVALPDEAVQTKIRPFLKKMTNLNSGFEQSMLWVASVEGKENIQKQDFLNPIYRETYLIVTNNLGRCASILLSSIESGGKKELQKFELVDVNENGTPEIVIETTSSSKNNIIENRNIEIYGFQTAMLRKIFEYDLTLTFDGDLPSPALSKHVEIEGSKIRIAYVDFVKNDQYSLKFPTDTKLADMERCIEYVTFSLAWNDRSKSFDTLYAPTRTAPYAYANTTTTLRNAPPPVFTPKGEPERVETPVLDVSPNEKLYIIKQVEVYFIDNEDKKQLKNYLYVKHPSGKLGYLPADAVRLRHIEHADLLNRYYEKTPLNKTDWKIDTAYFLNIK